MAPKLSAADLSKLMFEKNDCPGGHAGVFHTLEAGVRSDDIADPTLAAEWAVLETHFEATGPLCDAMFAQLHAAYCPIGHDHV